MSMIHCRIVTPHGVYKEVDTSILNIETQDGQRGILPEHMPIVTMLRIGKMTTIESGKRMEYAVTGGLFYFRDNKDEIDVERAIAAKIRAEQRLQSNDKNVDQVRAEIALKKALNRLNVKG